MNLTELEIEKERRKDGEENIIIKATIMADKVMNAVMMSKHSCTRLYIKLFIYYICGRKWDFGSMGLFFFSFFLFFFFFLPPTETTLFSSLVKIYNSISKSYKIF